jgi:rubredoxin
MNRRWLNFLVFAGLFATSSHVAAQLCVQGSSSTTGSQPCSPCAAGTFQDQPGQTVCPLCAPGQYQDQTGQTVCHDCGLGKYQEFTGQALCKNCAKGFYEDLTAAISCKLCPAGTFQNNLGSVGCVPCQAGTSSGLGASMCTAVAALNLGTAKAYPNPFRPAQGTALMTISSLPANARLRVYDAKGALVKELQSDSSGLAYWDGTNQSGANAASGIYFIFAQGAGETRTLKVAIQR